MDDLVDLIYEAGVQSELWPSVLDRMSGIAGADGGVLFAAGTGLPQWTASANMRDHMVAFVEEGWAANNARSAAAFRKRLSSFSTDHDTLEPEEIETAPIYRDFFRPRGFGWSIGTSIVPLTGDVLVVSLERRYELGPVDDACKAILDPLRPHLARAALLSARLGLERARSTVLSLEMVGLAAAVVTADGRMVASNRRLDAMTDTVVPRAFDRLALADAAAQKTLAAALRRLAIPQEGFAGALSFPATRPAGQPRIVHLVPLVATARDVFRKGDAVMIVADIGNGGMPEASLLEALFDLTPAETRVAQRAAAGTPLKTIARDLSLSHETVRTHMRAILRKSGARGQVELVRLVATLPSVRLPGQD
jgi:DNA-binding CsgD family transcriptional regulator